MTRIAVVGGGRIGEALIAGLRESGTEPSDIAVIEAVESRAAELAKKYCILETGLDIGCEGADVIVVAVKPGDVPAVVDRIGNAISDSVHESIVVSLAAGVPTSVLENRLSAGSPVVRVMPNTAMLVGQGVSAVCKGRYARDEHLEKVVAIMESVGSVVVVDESQMDAVTAVSGSGPAYFFLLAEAMVDAAVEQGISRDVALRLASGTALGAGAMLTGGGEGPADLRAGVSSPGGTTAAAIRRLEAGGLRSAVANAVEAAATRSLELAQAAQKADDDERGH
ncbi:pyrroline-5-carboxylate reductase [Dietzia sp. PP-33]|jgi:pyrroline-5-carboxylate reductase|uniref:pyrroline-5-carboxylate reductase n=1 Tax=Dietzia sp. PP-33 TaxID=2957500 RepID=UPI0029B03063|nr:pyrroline-5-carboxylate reductase [Dietzia sp. PP-33]MDX2358864.1 pyrroline-5-carboxylate reductase [Dietzia sp. PP-33]